MQCHKVYTCISKIGKNRFSLKPEHLHFALKVTNKVPFIVIKPTVKIVQHADDCTNK